MLEKLGSGSIFEYYSGIKDATLYLLILLIEQSLHYKYPNRAVTHKHLISNSDDRIRD